MVLTDPCMGSRKYEERHGIPNNAMQVIMTYDGQFTHLSYRAQANWSLCLWD